MSLMDVLNSFRGGSSSSTTPAQDGAAKNPTVPSDATVVPDGKGPVAFGNAAAATEDKSPLSGYKDLWQKADTDLKPVDPTVRFDADPQKVLQAAKGIDVLKAINPDLLTKAQAGNDPAALMQVINESVQVGIAHATQGTTGIVNAAIEQLNKKYETEIIPRILRDNNIRNTNRASDPLFENPAAAPMLSMVEQQLMIKYPNASPQEIQEKSREYMQEFSTAVLQTRGYEVAKAPDKKQQSDTSMDWTKWAERG